MTIMNFILKGKPMKIYRSFNFKSTIIFLPLFLLMLITENLLAVSTVCPGSTLNNLNNTTTNVTESTSVTMPATTTYYYTFTPQVTGRIQVISVANSPYNSLFIKQGCATNLWSDTNDGWYAWSGWYKYSPEISVQANQQIVIAFESRYPDNIDVTLYFTFVTNSLPIANAGADQNGVYNTPVTLDGSGSSDSDGNIISYIWSEGGTQIATGVNPSVTLSVGTHTITLTIIDNDGGTSTDTVTITMPPPPPADAINDNYTTSIDRVLSGNILLNDKGGALSITSNTNPTNGTLSLDSNGTFTYTPNSGYTGTDTFNYTITDNTGSTDTAQVTIQVNPPINENYRDFSLRFQRSLPGNIITVGNTILVAPTNNASANCNTYTNGSYISDATLTNNNYNLCAYWYDTNANFPTTTAEIALPNTSSRVVWAGLYWQSIVASPSTLSSMQIQIKHENDASYTSLNYDQLDWVHSRTDNNGNPLHDSYSAFKDITKLFIDNNWGAGKIIVGDIPVAEGIISNLGAYGAWSLVVVYKDKTQSIKNFSIYDGWVRIGNINAPTDSKKITIDGFRTPSSVSATNPIKASVSVFVAEGDKRITGDFLLAKPSLQPSSTTLKYASNQTFDSRVQTPNPFNRTPNPINNQGIDIQAFDLGTSGENIIKPNETSIELTLNDTNYQNGGSSMDFYWPSMISFSADLLVPKLCYDYVVEKDKYTLNAKDQNISSFGKGDLDIGIAIRSLEGDFDLENTSLELTLDSTAGLTFDNAFYSPNTVNILIPAINVPNVNSNPNIAIGENATSTGGTIDRLQRYFTRFDYTQTSNTYTGHFELDINTSIDFGSGPVEYHYSSANNTIKQCPISSIYAPQWLQFNVERTNSNPNTADQIRYPLYTQIVGRDFDLSVVSYDATAGAKPYTVPKSISDVTVDIELINAKPFGDQSFKCNNTFSSIIQPLPNGRKSFFARFPSAGDSRVNITSPTDMITTTALENAAFRMWILVDGNNSIISHTCEKPTRVNNYDNQCYIDNVHPEIHDTAHKCSDLNGDANCTGYISPRGTQGCYACYRDFFAKPICSRDNFSIRPESYNLTIIDDNENNSSVKKTLLTNNAILFSSFAAEYNYRFDGNATRFQSNLNALQYNIDVNASLIFNDNATCFDTNSTNSTHVLKNGIIINNNRYDARANMEHNNAGDYLLRMIDKLWTKVDQRGFINADGNDSKTFPGVDDCIRNNSTTSIDGNTLSGCDVASNFDATHTDMAVTFEPYKFDISQVNLALIPNDAATYLFMNDFSDAYYDSNDINMSARFTGLIQAKGKKNRTLTNFTKTCHSDDKNITLILNRTTSPVQESNITSTDKHGNKVKDVLFQQKLTMNNATDITVTGSDKNVSLSGLEFDPTQSGVKEGEALILLDTTFKKPSVKHAVVNPFDVNYSDMNATSLDSSSYAHQTYYTPEGNNTYNRSLIYYFAKVTPQKELYGPEEGSSIPTPISVDIYCSPDDGNSSICSSRFNLTTISHGIDEEAGWYAATMFTPPELSTVDLQIKTVFGNDSLPKVNDDTGSSNNVDFDDPEATQADINVSLGGPARPSTVDITVRQPPYLRYDKNDINGYMHYRVRFIGDSTWSGVGNTGNTIETTSNKNTNPRMNW